jgi:hypothetical protein
MNKKKQNIAIAKACGYTLSGGRIEWWTDKDGAHDEPPDYLNDLNAMNEAEKTLTDKQYDLSDSLAAYEDTSFSGWLFRIMVRRAENPDYRLYSASAAKRAEAFLRTLNLWEDSK